MLKESRSIDLGDCRILEQMNPELSQRLLKAADVNNSAFQSPEFKEAMRGTRSRCFEALERFLWNLHVGKHVFFGGQIYRLEGFDGNYAVVVPDKDAWGLVDDAFDAGLVEMMGNAVCWNGPTTDGKNKIPLAGLRKLDF